MSLKEVFAAGDVVQLFEVRSCGTGFEVLASYQHHVILSLSRHHSLVFSRLDNELCYLTIAAIGNVRLVPHKTVEEVTGVWVDMSQVIIVTSIRTANAINAVTTESHSSRDQSGHM